jgi:hypothetical protein
VRATYPAHLTYLGLIILIVFGEDNVLQHVQVFLCEGEAIFWPDDTCRKEWEGKDAK